MGITSDRRVNLLKSDEKVQLPSAALVGEGCGDDAARDRGGDDAPITRVLDDDCHGDPWCVCRRERNKPALPPMSSP